MTAATRGPQLKILHVLTLNGRNGEYGGPVRVARELCQELNLRGHQTHIISGAIIGSEPQPVDDLDESFVLVKPLSQRLKVSSLWSWRLIPSLVKQIKQADLIHIHFARDLIPFLSAFLSIILHRPFMTQTHGMIILDGRLSTRLVDLFFTRPILNKSSSNFVLTEFEAAAVKKIRIKSPSIILPNGVASSKYLNSYQNSKRRVVFCSRLDKRKGVDKFIKIAESFKNEKIHFEIYGPDGGELDLVQREIRKRNISDIIEYRGSLASSEVENMLKDVDLLVLPSQNEPFPMVILEALAVGTQVLVMPSCGFAGKLKNFETAFVSETEDLEGLIRNFQKFASYDFKIKSGKLIQEFCNSEFGIAKVVDQLLPNYQWSLSRG